MPDASMEAVLQPTSPTMARLIEWEGGDYIEPQTIYLAIGILLASGHDRYARILREALNADEGEALH
ncbi:MAG TPA: hypothetical protein VMX97_08975 [Hyphomicrobiaceae bacterium]|nr:hypothetical protein [Hyphomicrobiaceae bacterium]